jgi:hypothetical protein
MQRTLLNTPSLPFIDFTFYLFIYFGFDHPYYLADYTRRSTFRLILRKGGGPVLGPVQQFLQIFSMKYLYCTAVYRKPYSQRTRVAVAGSYYDQRVYLYRFQEACSCPSCVSWRRLPANSRTAFGNISIICNFVSRIIIAGEA